MSKNKGIEKNKLNEKQELFCKYFVSKEFFGSGVEAYAEAYGMDLENPKNYNSAKANASKLLTNTNILTRINEELQEAGLNDNFVDKQLLFAITQNADINSKVKAIGEYNKLRQRITDRSKVSGEVTIKVKYDRIRDHLTDTDGSPKESIEGKEEV